MAVCLAVLEWKHYLLGGHFIIRTDQRSLKYLTQQREIASDYQKWVGKLMGYDFEVPYKPGTSNRVADALSRKSCGEVKLGVMISSKTVDRDEVNKEKEADGVLEKIGESCK